MHQTMLTWAQRGWLWLRLGIRIILVLLAALFLWKFLPPLLSLFAPFVLALITAAILNPLIKWLQRRLGISRGFLTLVILFALVGGVGSILAALIYVAGMEIVSLAQNWETLFATSQSLMQNLEQLFSHVNTLLPEELLDILQQTTSQLMTYLQSWLSTVMGNLAGAAGQRAIAIPSFFISLLMFVMGSYFLTADYPYLRTRFIGRMDEGPLAFLREVKAVALTAFGGYFKAQFLLSVGVFFILLAGFLITRRSYSLLLALLLAILDFIPIIGSGTVMVPWAVIALVSRDFSTAIEIIIIWGIVALFRRVAEPKFVGNETGLSPILSLISIYVGMKVAGVAGMILAPILAMIGLNLAGLGLFRGFQDDISAAVGDIVAILHRRPNDA